MPPHCEELSDFEKWTGRKYFFHQTTKGRFVKHVGTACRQKVPQKDIFCSHVMTCQNLSISQCLTSSNPPQERGRGNENMSVDARRGDNLFQRRTSSHDWRVLGSRGGGLEGWR